LRASIIQSKGIIFVLALAAFVFAVPAGAKSKAAPPQTPRITGQYIEARTADIWTGPCIANSEMNLAGKQAVMAWHIDHGAWGNVSLDGLSVVAVVRSNNTLGDPDTNPLPARAVMIVDQSASDAQRSALVNFAQSQASGLLDDVVATESAPIAFQTNVGGNHMAASLSAGNMLRVTTRGIGSTDELCHNEEVYYPPLAANLTHSMPAVATQASYQGGHLGATWNEAERRGVFLADFAY
jgi:hypothetical protein